MRRLLAIACLTLGLAACGGGGGTSAPATAPASSVPTITAEPPETTAEAGPGDDPCALVSEDDLGAVFASGVPEGDSNVFGAGFGECEWEGDDAYLSVAVIPAANFSSDFVEQLNVTGPVESDALGDDAVFFPGVVGIARASGGGVSVGFSKGDSGVIVAVKTGADGDPAGDLALATQVAESIAAGL